MPVLIPLKYRDTEFYFDLRKDKNDASEGFWAVPLFEEDQRRIRQEQAARGESERTWVEFLIFAVRRWQGFTDENGAELPCTPENIRALCVCIPTVMMGMLEQILEAGKYGQRLAEGN